MKRYNQTSTERLINLDYERIDDKTLAKYIRTLVRDGEANPNVLFEHNQSVFKYWVKSNICSPMHLCAYYDKPLALKTLLECGGKSDLVDNFKNQPMHFACSADLAKILQQFGANVNAKNNAGEIPPAANLKARIRYAFCDEQIKLAMKELENYARMGAILDTPDNSGKTIFDAFSDKYSEYASMARNTYKQYKENLYYQENIYSTSADFPYDNHVMIYYPIQNNPQLQRSTTSDMDKWIYMTSHQEAR